MAREHNGAHRCAGGRRIVKDLVGYEWIGFVALGVVAGMILAWAMRLGRK